MLLFQFNLIKLKQLKTPQPITRADDLETAESILMEHVCLRIIYKI